MNEEFKGLKGIDELKVPADVKTGLAKKEKAAGSTLRQSVKDKLALYCFEHHLKEIDVNSEAVDRYLNEMIARDKEKGQENK